MLLAALALLELLELLEPLVPALLAAVVLDELLQAAVISTEAVTAAPAAITCRARKVFPPRPLPPFPRGERELLARQVEIMTGQVKREVSGNRRPSSPYGASWRL
jgi:hypothetical protein